MLFLHGGGFVAGPVGYDAPLRHLALLSDCRIVALHYRLAPEHRFPAAIEDAVAGGRRLARIRSGTSTSTSPGGRPAGTESVAASWHDGIKSR